MALTLAAQARWLAERNAALLAEMAAIRERNAASVRRLDDMLGRSPGQVSAAPAPRAARAAAARRR